MLLAKLTISGIGDISVAGKLDGRPESSVFSKVSRIFEACDLVIGNLESPLTASGQPTPGKCSLRGLPEWARIMKSGGVGVVSLGNNHLMDYGEKGLFSTVQALDNSQIKYVGAGKNREEAYAPVVLEVKGIKIAFLARTAVVVSSPSYAGYEQAGVGQLDIQEVKKTIRACKQQADKVILLIHWGIEEYAYPSPEQRRLSKDLMNAGVDILLGHHPHVLQGVERIGRGLVCYSLGNFMFDDVEWSFKDRDGNQHNLVSRLSEGNRKGGILKVVLSGKGIDSYELIPTRISHDRIVRIEDTKERQREFKRLCSRLHWPAYSLFWRLYSLRMEWELRLKAMTIDRLRWANMKKIRPRHLRELYQGIRRSGKITAEKSTNPYE